MRNLCTVDCALLHIYTLSIATELRWWGWYYLLMAPLDPIHLMGGRSGILGRLTLLSINMVKVTLPFFCCLLQLNIHVACIERPHPLLARWAHPYICPWLACWKISDPVGFPLQRGTQKLLTPPMAYIMSASLHLTTLSTATELHLWGWNNSIIDPSDPCCHTP